MKHILSVRLHLTWVLTLVLCLLHTHATAQLQTLAWTKQLKTAGHIWNSFSVAQDSSENSYALLDYYTPNTSDSIVLRGFNIDGSLKFSTTLFSSTLGALPSQVVVTPAVGGIQYILASYTYQDAQGHMNVGYSKVSTSGGILWTYTVSGGLGNAYPLGMDGDTAGNAYFATGGNDPGKHIEFATLNSAGTIINHKINTNFVANTAGSAYHVGSRWIVSGSNTAIVSTNTMWASFDDTSGAIQFSQTLVNFANSSFQYNYTFLAVPYNGGIAVSVGLVAFPVGGGSAVTEFAVRSFTFGGVFNWESPWRVGVPDTITPSSGPIYVSGGAVDGAQPFVCQVSNAGSVLWYKSFPNIYTPQITADGNGFFMATYNPSAPGPAPELLYRYNTAGLLQFTSNVPNATPQSLSSDGLSTFVLNRGNGTNFNGFSLQRYVGGFALSDVNPSTTMATTGDVVTFTIHFNSPTPSTTLVNLVSTTPDLLFNNVSQAINLFIPSGTTTYKITATAQFIGMDEPAEVITTCNGVKRYALVALSP